MSIGSRIKDLRKTRGLTQILLAQKASISRSYLADIEGDRYNPSVETLKSIALALHVDPAYFVTTDTSASSIDETFALSSESDYSDLPPEAIEEINKFKEYVRSKYAKK